MRAFLQVLLILFLLLGIVGLFAVDTAAGWFLLLGGAIAIVLAVLYIALRRYRRVAVPVLVGLAVVAGVLWSVQTSDVFVPTDSLSEPESGAGDLAADEVIQADVTGYRIFVEPVSGERHIFRVTEEAIFSATLPDGSRVTEQLQVYETRTLTAQRSGFALWVLGINVTPRLTTSTSFSSDALATEAVGTICTGGTCPVTEVELLDFPEGAFLDARGAEDISRSTFVDTETISFTTQSLRAGIDVAYVPSPYNRLLFLLRPFLGAAAFEDWVFGFVGVLGSFLLFPIIATFLENYLEGKAFSGFQWLLKCGKDS